MKHAKTGLAVLLIALLVGNPMLAQNKKTKKSAAKTTTEAKPEKPQEALITVTTLHRNLSKKDGSADEWLALEKYFTK